MTLAQILKNKPPGLISVPPEMTVDEVIDILAERRIGAVLVVAAGKLAGIVSERDIVRSLAKIAAGTFDLTAASLMTTAITTATPDVTVAQAMEMMTQGRFRHLPVMDKGELIGLVSIGDVVKARIDQQEHEVDSLRAYVTGAA